ncbi:MAG: mutual gliding-motility protein MglA [Thermoanaerobaculia bacterium]|jgi:signal recognition particle receptor subunit beta|nr:mutual gliding-motility protein MglA [Thermoanaerobaculia bacterium]
MVLINKALNEITVKLVYYGPGLCGKTTNLEKIYGNPKLEHKGKMISMSTETDRTLFFDFMPMELGTIAGQKVRVQLYTVPGQVFYDATRKLVLRGADGVVFVADSQSTMRDSNLDSFENLKTNLRLNRIDPEKVALVLQYNKRDLPNVDSVDEMNAYLNPYGVPTVEASAITGAGVTATLRAAVTRILDNLKKNVDTTLHEGPELAAPDMSAKSGVTSMSAGTPKLSMKTTPASSPEPPPFDAEKTMAVSPFEPQTYEPESYNGVAVAEEEDPFGAMAAVEPVPDQAGDPFGAATVIHDPGAERAELEALLASASAVVRALESALDQARKHESALRAKLG